MARLLRHSHVLAPDQLCDAVVDYFRPVGVHLAVVYLVDMQQGWLRPMPGAHAADRPAQAIDATLAGRAFQLARPQVTEAADGRPRLWLPVLDGSERLGVLELVVDGADGRSIDRYSTLASLLGLLIVSKSKYSDTYAQVKRVRPMQLKAEMEWAFMPPLSLATDRAMVNVAVEPAYEVGGDAFDYSLAGDLLHVALFDACGHDLTAGIAASVAMAACRNSRRAGAGLEEIAARADEVIHVEFGPRRFVTALLCELDLSTGRFSWIPCGHPPPLLVRRNRATELSRPPRPPLGIPPDDDGHYRQVQQLQPRDRLLLYTDGVTEARDATGREFGVPRLVDFVNQHAGEGVPTPEALRRLGRAILAHQSGQLSDDAIIVQVQWQPEAADRFVA